MIRMVMAVSSACSMAVVMIMLLAVDHLSVGSRHVHDHRFEFDDEFWIGYEDSVISADIEQYC